MTIADSLAQLVAATAVVPSNKKERSTAKKKIRELCKTLLPLAHSDTPGFHSAVKRHYRLLKRQFLDFVAGGIFKKLFGTSTTASQLSTLLDQMEPYGKDLSELKTLAKRDCSAFEALMRETDGFALKDPDLRQPLLQHLAEQAPQAFFSLEDLIELSPQERSALALTIARRHPQFLQRFLNYPDQGVMTRMLLAAFPGIPVWEHSLDLLKLFKVPNYPQHKQQEALNRFGIGICLGHATTLITNPNPNEPRARFLQAASHGEALLHFPFYTALGKRLLQEKDKIPEVLAKIQSIYHLDTLDESSAYQIGAAAFHLCSDKSSPFRQREEATVVNDLRDQLAEEMNIPKTNSIPDLQLRKEGIQREHVVLSGEPIAQFAQKTQPLENGKYIVILKHPEGNGHALHLSLDPPRFSDLNDWDPQTLEPFVRTFNSKEELLRYVEAHIAIYYKKDGFLSFDVERYTVLPPTNEVLV